jgi:hypothetical protein
MTYTFVAKPWQHEGSWVFVSLPKSLAIEIRQLNQWQEAGWGRFPVAIGIGTHTWKTSMWFDTKHQTYLIPLKLEVRKKLNITCDQLLEVTLILG